MYLHLKTSGGKNLYKNVISRSSRTTYNMHARYVYNVLYKVRKKFFTAFESSSAYYESLRTHTRLRSALRYELIKIIAPLVLKNPVRIVMRNAAHDNHFDVFSDSIVRKKMHALYVRKSHVI